MGWTEKEHQLVADHANRLGQVCMEALAPEVQALDVKIQSTVLFNVGVNFAARILATVSKDEVDLLEKMQIFRTYVIDMASHIQDAMDGRGSDKVTIAPKSPEKFEPPAMKTEFPKC